MCNNVKKDEQDNAGMKVTEMTDVKVKEMITRIQKAGDTLTSDRLRMVIAKSHENGGDRKGERGGRQDQDKAEGVEQGGADKGNSEGEGAVQWDENDYLLAKPRLVEADDSDYSTVVQRTGQARSPTGPSQKITLPIPST